MLKISWKERKNHYNKSVRGWQVWKHNFYPLSKELSSIQYWMYTLTVVSHLYIFFSRSMISHHFVSMQSSMVYWRTEFNDKLKYILHDYSFYSLLKCIHLYIQKRHKHSSVLFFMLLLKRFFGRICHPFLNTINIQKKFVFCYVYKKNSLYSGHSDNYISFNSLVSQLIE